MQKSLSFFLIDSIFSSLYGPFLLFLQHASCATAAMLVTIFLQLIDD